MEYIAITVTPEMTLGLREGRVNGGGGGKGNLDKIFLITIHEVWSLI